MLDCFLVVFEDKADALIPYAVSAAQALNAHVTAVSPTRGGSSNGAAARAGLEAFAEAAKAAGVSADIVAPEADEHPSREALPRFARTFDFAMAQQREPGRPPTRDDLTAALLSDSGRPVWVVPAIQREPARFKHVLVAWDGGAGAGAGVQRSQAHLRARRAASRSSPSPAPRHRPGCFKAASGSPRG